MPAPSCRTALVLCSALLLQVTNAAAQDLAKYSPSFIKGILAGCIDGQKKQLQRQGLQYPPNEELVWQYCHCMTPISADISNTKEGRQKLLDGDPAIKKRVQNAEAICLDGIKNGRTFAPTQSQVSPVSSYSSQENAYGRIIGTYWSALSVTEVCAEYGNLRAISQATAKAYAAANKHVYDKAGQRMLQIAKANGGTAAAAKLQAEVKEMISNKADMQNEVRRTASTEAMCSTMLQNLKRGDWDITRRNPRELSIIIDR